MKFDVSDIPLPPNPIPSQTWIITVLSVEPLAIIVGIIVLIAFRVEKRKAFLASSVSVIASFLAGMIAWSLLGVI